MQQINHNELKSFLYGFLTFLKKNNSEGLMLIRLKQRGLTRDINQAKDYIKFQENSTNDIDNFIDSFFEARSKEQIEHPFANWYFSEITKKTKSLKDLYKHVKNSDFHDEKKTFLYFDMDLKDQINKLSFERMTAQEKKDFITVKSFSKLESLKKLDPLYITFTGNGLHVGFNMSSKITNEDTYVSEYTKMAEKLTEITGWRFDLKCTNLARIDRLPYTENIKSNVQSEDLLSDCLFSNWSAGTGFLEQMIEKFDSEEVKNLVQDSKTPQTIYSVFSRLRTKNYEVYRYIKENLTFQKLFEHYSLTEKLGVRSYASTDGFKRCFSPFREETLPSFGYDEKTGVFFDFGNIPNLETDNGKGDIIGLAYGLEYYKVNNEWPVIIDIDLAQEVALNIIGGKNEVDILKEATTFSRDESGKIIPDIKMISLVFLNYLLNKYDIVYSDEEKMLLFREKNSFSEYLKFPEDVPEFGYKSDEATATLLINSCGVSVPPPSLKSNAKIVVSILKDQKSIIFDGYDKKFCRFTLAGMEHILIPVMNRSNPVLKFKNGVYYEVMTGKLHSSYDGFVHVVDANFVPLNEKLQTPYWDKLLDGLVGPEYDDRRKVVQFMFAQMWVPAHGNSRAVIFKGYGANGKSSWIRTLQGILPKGVFHSTNMGAFSGTSNTDTAERVKFKGKHLIFVEDMEKYEIKKDLKALITGEAGATARELHKNPTTFTNKASLIFMANSIPSINGDHSALLRRLITVETPFSVAEKIFKIEDLIIENEKDGVWQYIINSIETFRKTDFMFPEEEDWAKRVTTISRNRLLNRTSIGEVALSLIPCPGKVVMIDDLHRAYNLSAEVKSTQKMGIKSFAEKMAGVAHAIEDLRQTNNLKEFKEDNNINGVISIEKHSQLVALVNVKFVPEDEDMILEKEVPLTEIIKKYGKPGQAIIWEDFDHPFKSKSDIVADLSQTNLFKKLISNKSETIENSLEETLD